MTRPARVLPGFALGLSTTILYLGALVLLPLGAAVFKACELSPSEFWAAVSGDRAVAAYRLTVTASLAAAAVNVALGVVVAWTLVRYEFRGRALLNALVDVPFALPTAVAGLVYATLYAGDGWLGRWLVPLGFEGAYTRTGIILVLTFTGFPFVVRTMQPVLEDLDPEVEQAAATLGASRLQTFCRVILPVLVPPALTGFTLAFARALGEYGSVIFISSNLPFRTEIAPVLIVSRLEEFAYREAAAIAVALLAFSFCLLIVINTLERFSRPGSVPRWAMNPLKRLARRAFAPAARLWDAAVPTPERPATGRFGHAPGPAEARAFIAATTVILTVLIVVPIVSVFAQALSLGVRHYVLSLVGDPETRHAIFLSLVVAPLAVAMNTAFGVAAAYTIARFRFPGRTVLTTLLDLPFSVSPVVAGLALVLCYGQQAPIGAWLKAHGFQVIFAPPALVLATAFVTFPFVARELIPVLEAQGPEEEMAARSLGASGRQMFLWVTLPNIRWGLVYGVILCHARAIGEFGAIYVVSGRIGGRTDTMPLRVEKLFQEYQQPAAFALASLLTLFALATLLLKVAVEERLRRDQQER